MKHQRNSESGQSIVLVALALVVLLGFLGLAIDGGRLYTQTRDAQNAVDGAAMAGAAKLCGTGVVEGAEEAARDAAGHVGYDDNGVDNTVVVNIDTTTEEIEVAIWTEIPATIAQIVYSGGLETNVRATGRCFRGGTPSAFNGLSFGIISLGTTCSNSSGALDTSGGGHSGGITTHGSHMFVNVPGSAQCALNPSNSNSAPGIHAAGDYCIYSAGTYNYGPPPAGSSLDDCIIPLDTGPIGDPLAQAPVPNCGDVAGTKTGNIYSPGNWNGAAMGAGTYLPGIYCISGDVTAGGSSQLTGHGVVFYFRDGGTKFTGNSGLKITAPTADNCEGTVGSTTASCTFKGMVIFMARNNSDTIQLNGNGENRIVGTVYGPQGTFIAGGGGNTAEDSLVFGQVIMAHVHNNGNGNLNVWYDADVSYVLPSTLGLVE